MNIIIKQQTEMYTDLISNITHLKIQVCFKLA